MGHTSLRTGHSLANNVLTSLLETHGIQCDVDDAGCVWAVDEIVKRGRDHSEWVEVTGWTRERLLSWLGY